MSRWGRRIDCSYKPVEFNEDLIESNHRNHFRYNSEERFKYCDWLKHNKTLLNAGEMKEDRVDLLEKLL